jgi:hypothetical protein
MRKHQARRTFDLRSRLRSRAHLVLATALVTGCAAEVAEPAHGETVGQRSDELYLMDPYASQTFDRTIPVCFNSATATRSDFTTIRRRIKDIVARTWTQATGLRFKGVSSSEWQQCPQDGFPATINIGYGACGGSGAQTCSPALGGCQNRIDINFCVDAISDATVAHEFGHALGFTHEFNRPDFTSTPTCPGTPVPGGDPLGTIPDESSILNSTYCHLNPELSYWDIAGSQNLWGRPNFFADVTGDGFDDAIVANSDGVWIRTNDGTGHFPVSTQRNWTGGPQGATKGMFFADVTGDKKADLVIVETDGLYVRKSNGSSFGAATSWNGPFWGDFGTYFVDVTGDGKADGIAIDSNTGVFVIASDGTKFLAEKNWWPHDMHTLNTRESKNYFFDVTGPDSDGRHRADLIAINSDGIKVCPAKASGGFSDTCTNWRSTFLGNRGTFFADIDGDGRDDAVTINGSNGTSASVKVALSSGTSFGSSSTFISSFTSERGAYFANVLSGKSRELVFVKDSGVFVQKVSTSSTAFNATGGAFYGLR